MYMKYVSAVWPAFSLFFLVMCTVAFCVLVKLAHLDAWHKFQLNSIQSCVSCIFSVAVLTFPMLWHWSLGFRINWSQFLIYKAQPTVNHYDQCSWLNWTPEKLKENYFITLLDIIKSRKSDSLQLYQRQSILTWQIYLIENAAGTQKIQHRAVSSAATAYLKLLIFSLPSTVLWLLS